MPKKITIKIKKPKLPVNPNKDYWKRRRKQA